MIAPTVAKRIVPELLGAGCSLLELKLEGIQVGKYDVSINRYKEYHLLTSSLPSE
jgi:hypothetical protein